MDVEAKCEPVKDESGNPVLDHHCDTVKKVIGPEPPTPDAMLAELDLWGWRGILHTSYSHTPEHPRYRLTLALSRPLAPSEVKALGLHVAGLMGIVESIDTGCLEPARLFYLPRAPDDRKELFRHAETQGAVLPVDLLLEQIAKVEQAKKSGQATRPTGQSGNVIEAFNAAHDVALILEKHGYQPKGGERWLWSGSTSGLPGVRLLHDSERVYSSHGGDPLNDGHAHDAFDLFRILQHDGDVSAAVKEAVRILGMKTGSGAPAGDLTSDLATIAVTTDEGKPRPQSAVLIDIGRTHKLFHDSGGDAYAQIDNGGCCAIGGMEYREILSGAFYRLTGKGANKNALADAMNTLAAVGKFEGHASPVFLRVGECDDGIVIDSGRQDRSCFVVTAAGWSTIGKPPIHFRRSGKPLALPEPTKPNFGLLWKYANVQVADRVLIAAWLLAALRPRGPFPIPVFISEQGTGKSRLTRVLKSLVDPSASPLRAPPQDVKDLLVAAISTWVLALDNMSGADPKLSDALCRLSTGGALSGRTLYTNSEETLIEVQRPVILNGIDDLATRPDLAERCIVVEMTHMTLRMTEHDLDAGFQRDAGAIFAALLDGLTLALRDAHALKIANLPRMADFVKWAAAGVPALGFTGEEFLAAYRANQVGAIETGLDSSQVGQSIRKLMEGRIQWSGSAAELLRELAVHSNITERSWLRSPKGLMNSLRRLGPSLRHTGITWSQDRTAAQRSIVLCKGAGQASEASQVTFPNDGMTLMTDDRPPSTIEVEI